MSELLDVLPWLRRLSLHVQAIAVAVDELYDRRGIRPRLDRELLADLLRRLDDVVEQVGRTSGSRPAEELHQSEGDALEDASAHHPVADVLDSVSLLGRIDQLRAELTDADLVPPFVRRYGVDREGRG